MWEFEVQEIGTTNIFKIVGKNFKDACVRNDIKMSQIRILKEEKIS